MNYTKSNYRLYEWKNDGTWDFIRVMSYDEVMTLMNEWESMDGYTDNDFGIINNMIMFSHHLLDRVFIAEVF